MKKTVALVLMLMFVLTACGSADEFVQKSQNVASLPALSEAEEQSAPMAESQGAPSNVERAPEEEVLPLPETEPVPNKEEQRRTELEELTDYWDKLRLEWEWDQQDNEGYVWTINIDQITVLDVMGLASVSYDLDLSCSHTGPTMDGVYSGTLAMEYEADLNGMVELLTLAGGSIDYDADGWFENDRFVMRLQEYDELVELQFDSTLTASASDLTEEEQAIVDAYVGSILEGVGSGDEEFEKDSTPAATWYDWDFHMTAGDMSGYINMTGICFGIAGASGTVDESGVQTQGSAYASAFGYSFSERYAEEIQNPFPYAIRVYETGQVVFELYSSNGGPVTVKFYGTIDKIPVGDTVTVD